MADIPTDNLLLCGACICCFNALYTDMAGCIGCSGQEECLCIEYEVCCRSGAKPYGPGLATGNGNWCQLQCVCCQYTCKPPAICCKGKGQFCCLVNQAAFPPGGDVPMMCAICFVSLYPNFGIMKKVSENQK